MVLLARVSGLYGSSAMRLSVLVLAIVSLLALLFTLRTPIHDFPFGKGFIAPHPSHGSSQPRKIVGLVFYGRREFVSILDCYLQRNLAINGGLLDEVVFSVNTNNEADLKYLDALVASNPKYTKFQSSKEYAPLTWGGSWEPVEHGNLYIKIDDDVIFFEDNTIESLVTRLTENPQYFAVSANVINNPALSWVHYSMGLYEAYFPELTAPAHVPQRSWRASELPYWEGPADFEFDGSKPAPYPNHRWLPVKGEFDIVKTPAKDLSFDAEGGGLHSWAAAAQTHYSFLDHLEKQDTYRYKFDFWDYHYSRLSINFFAVWGSDLIDAYPFPGDDEAYLTMKRPKDLGRHVIVDGQGLAVHFAFGPQREAHERKGLFDTDLLQRYRAYAEELICPFPNRTDPASEFARGRSSNSPYGR